MSELMTRWWKTSDQQVLNLPRDYEPPIGAGWEPVVVMPEAEAAALRRLKEDAAWIVNDANYKAPEQIGDIAQRWIAALRRALESP